MMALVSRKNLSMFKATLDQLQLHHKLDKSGIYQSLINFSAQVEQAWTETSLLASPSSCQLATNIVVAGMGGSALGGRIIRSLDQYILNVPLEIVNNYRLPNYVNSNSLVIVCSYSGNTEEALSCLQDAISRKAKIFVIASGGALAARAQEKNLDRYIFDPKYNPSGQPRMGLGYSITAIFCLLSHCQFINFTTSDHRQIVDLLDSQVAHYRLENNQVDNAAKLLAVKLHQQSIIIFSANHLVGTAHAIKNMLNENSKVFAASFDLPELDHHLLEGLQLPKSLKDHAHFLLLNSNLYPEAIKQRLQVTRTLLDKMGYRHTMIKPESVHPTLQAFEALSFGGFVSYYLAILSNIDPGPIPTVDFLKNELAKLQIQPK